jgi:putative DNA primase/helicase
MKNHDKKSMRIELEAIAEDLASGEFLAIIKFLDIDGKGRSIILPRAELDDVRMLEKTLKNAGCFFSPKRSYPVLRKLAKSTKAVARWEFAARTGWHNGHRQFVHPDQVIGNTPNHVLVKPPRPYRGEQSSALKIVGSHKEWVRGVASRAPYSSRLVLGICMGLAAPLLDFVDLNSFGVLVHGVGKAGKSTLLVAAGSVGGYGSERDLPNFRATDAALGELPASSNDMLLPINELGLLKGRAAERSERVRDLSYGLAEGRGTTYSKLAPISKSDAEMKWRSLALASGEEASEQIAQAAGHTRTVGAAIRWIDICATRDGADDIFDFCPNTVSVRDRREWARQQCIALRESCCAHRGVALKHFIRRVIKRRRSLRPQLRSLMNQFIKQISDKDDHPAVRHLATCFALIAAAGCLGIRFKTLPWTKKFVFKCIKRCYRDARRALRTESDLLEEGLRILRDRIRSRLVVFSPQKPYPNCGWHSADGYQEKTDFGAKVTIRGEAFKGWFADRRQPAIVLRWYRSKNRLTGGHRSQPGTSITWAESQPKWPDGSRPRSIVVNRRAGVLLKRRRQKGRRA